MCGGIISSEHDWACFANSQCNSALCKLLNRLEENVAV